MKTTFQTRRLLLDEESAEHLKHMMVVLSGEASHLALSPSKVVSWVVSEFATHHFPKDKERMKKGFLNRKAFLHALVDNLKDGNDEEIDQLKSALVGLKSDKRRLPQVTNQEMKPEATLD